MRSRACYFVAAFLSYAVAAQAQTSRPAASPRPQATKAAKATPTPRAAASPTAAPATPAPAPARPQFRPAVLVTGPDSLVNRINVAELQKKGQKDGAVKFAVNVGPDGVVVEAWTYHAMPECEELEKEVLQQLVRARFTPPIYNHQPVTVLLYGTVIFDADDLPHLRILLNQDPNEISEARDFIGPQPVVGADSQFKGLNPPEALPVAIDGVVDVEIGVDAGGNLRELNVLNEDPPLLGFADAVRSDFAGAKFIPAFRDGDVAESRSIMSVCYKPVGVAPEPEPLQLGPPPEQ